MPTIKFCLACSNQIKRQPRERKSTFDGRRCCSWECIEKSRGTVTKQANSLRARKHLGTECDACGTGGRLIVHHVDQDNGNNQPENIQTLCKPCHDFWHSTAKRLGIPVAGRMPRIIP